MNPLLFYTLKVVLCSGVLVGYYWVALRNKLFHRWNRFYLLACVVLSLTIPLLKINFWPVYTSSQNKVLRILNVVTSEREAEVISTARPGFFLSTAQWLWLGYFAVSAVVLVVIAASAVRIWRLLRAHPKTILDGITFLNTDAKGTPFSFFHFIIWNEAIDLNTDTGRRIFQHEVVHVQQRHTWDKVFLLLILVPFWSNPAFWIIRKELNALHEFEADQKAMQSGDAATLAQLILNTAFPQQAFLFTSHLFQSTIKRRIAMFTKLQNPKVSYLSRIIALPLLFAVVAAFSVKLKAPAGRQAITLDKTITVVVDAGHGSNDGARWKGVYEDDIVLAIAKRVKSQNENANIRIVLTRDNDKRLDLKNRVAIAAEAKADLFISIHVNAAVPGGDPKYSSTQGRTNGIEVIVPTQNSPYQTQSELLGSALVEHLKTAYPTYTSLIKQQIGIWVIDNNICPAVLIECGYITNRKDFDFITKEDNQTLVADKILAAIAQYGLLKNSGRLPEISDTVPQRYKNKDVKDVAVISGNDTQVVLTYGNNKKDTLTPAEAEKAKLVTTTRFMPPVIEKDTVPATGDINVRRATPNEAQAFVGAIELDGKIFKGAYKDLPVKPEEIESMSIVNGGDIEKEYDLKPGGSLLSITTKAYGEKMRKERDPATKPVFTKTEVAPRFPDTDGGWRAFLQKNLKPDVAITNNAKAGTYKVEVQFIVDESGKLSDIKPVTNFGHGMEEEAVRVLTLSPDWIPAKQNGHNVASYHKQPFTFIISEDE